MAALSFTLWHAEALRPPVRFTATVTGNTLRGTCQSDGDAPMAWGGVRTGRLRIRGCIERFMRAGTWIARTILIAHAVVRHHRRHQQQHGRARGDG